MNGQVFYKSLFASLMICIGCCVNLCCDNKYIGAFLFSIALLTICYMDANLYTGKIGYLKKENAVETFFTLCWNFIYTIAFSAAIYFMLLDNQEVLDKATVICVQKLSQHWLITFCKSFFCGVIMYIAVEIYKRKESPLGILLGIPTFILCGFEHSIADTAYFVIGDMFSPKVLLFVAICIIGNSLGSLFAKSCVVEIK